MEPSSRSGIDVRAKPVAWPFMARMLAALILLVLAVAPASAKETPLTLAERVADWQLTHRTGTAEGKAQVETVDPYGWIQASFWIGLTDLAERSRKPRYRQAIIDMGSANNWQPGARTYHADDHAITQVYLWAARQGVGEHAIVPIRMTFDSILAKPPHVGLPFHAGPKGSPPPECLARWCWADALFMAPAAWIDLSRQTGDPRYRAYALAELRATIAFLYDPAERLFYRDSRFFDRRDAQGRKQFWARGNGWVFAGLARIIPMLPSDDPDRAQLEALFREMAGRIRELQKPDGYWAPSLLAPEGSPPETSGTSFFTYGIAWGIRQGLLDATAYAPTVRRGWAALERAVQPDGRLGWVQQVSDQPDKVAVTDSQYYGVGAFLLAASAVAGLDLSAPRPDRPDTVR